MGLDQYGYTSFGDEEKKQIAYWRKHNRLHGWMANLAVEKGIVSDPETFNCVDLELTEADIDSLEDALISFGLPETGGYFFGPDSYDPERSGRLHDQDMSFLAYAREAIENGGRVFYDAWF